MSELPFYPRNARPAFHEQDAIDRLVAIVITLTSEVSVLRDRLATLQQLGEDAGWLAPGAVEGHAPDMAERQRREADREALLARVFAIMQADIAAPAGGNRDFWGAIAEIEGKPD